MKVLVTGATGFVGRVLVARLRDAGHSLKLAVRTLPPGANDETVVVGDIGPATEWGKALEGVDAVVHLAARVHVMRDSAAGAAEFRRVNTQGTLALARAAAEVGARRFVFLSSIKVNGEATAGRPFRADDPPNPSDAYGHSKLEAELGLSEVAGLESVILRPPLVHGPAVKGNLARFCRLAQTGLPVPFGGIDNRRDLVGVDNLVDLIARSLDHPAAPGQVFLASDGEALSTSRLYATIAAAIERPARMFRVPSGLMRAFAGPLGLGGEVDRLTQSLEIDIAKTRERLGWTPPVRAADGIVAMARAHRRDAT